jgi:ubiquinone/menaquinone biosynthesis C-methylase UbiE
MNTSGTNFRPDFPVSDDRKVSKYFHTQAANFDAIYSGKKNAVLRFLDAQLRKDMQRRFDLTFRECEDVSAKTVLDVGCGSGRYAIEFAKRGAAKVVGLDYAPNMIEIAKQISAQYSVADKCEFHCTEFLSYRNSSLFDITLAIGVFDYVKDPSAILKRMSRVTRERVIATFPVRWTCRTPVRKIRLGLQKCPVYFFTPQSIDRLFRSTGYRSHEIIYKGQIYFVVASPLRGQE